MDGITKLWQEIFKVNPGIAVMILVLAVWHLIIKPIYRDIASAKSNSKTTNAQKQQSTESEQGEKK